MKRSGGVTFSAVFIFIGSAFQLLAGSLILIGFSPGESALPAGVPHFVLYSVYAIAVLCLGMACWGIVTGVGLLRLRNWARISTLVFAGLLLLVSLPAVIMVPFLPLQGLQNSSGNEDIFVRVFIGIFYGLCCALGAWWIYFFNRRPVKVQFNSKKYPITPAMSKTTSAPVLAPANLSNAKPAFAPSYPARGASPRRPVSITVIAVLLFAGACTAPFAVLLFKGLSIQFPMLLFGYLIHGWAAIGLYVGLCVANFVAGIGLWRLKLWGRTLAICVFAFGILNCLDSLLHPAGLTLMQNSMADIYGNILPAQESANITSMSSRMFPVSMWVGLIIGAASAVVQMWFVVARKQAFIDAGKARRTPS